MQNIVCFRSSVYFIFIYFLQHILEQHMCLFSSIFGIKKKKKNANNFTEHQKLNHLLRARVTTRLRAPNYTVEQVNQRASTV